MIGVDLGDRDGVEDRADAGNRIILAVIKDRHAVIDRGAVLAMALADDPQPARHGIALHDQAGDGIGIGQFIFCLADIAFPDAHGMVRRRSGICEQHRRACDQRHDGFQFCHAILPGCGGLTPRQLIVRTPAHRAGSLPTLAKNRLFCYGADTAKTSPTQPFANHSCPVWVAAVGGPMTLARQTMGYQGAHT